MNRELTQPDDVRKAAQEIVNSGKGQTSCRFHRSHKGALGVDSENCIQVVPPPVKSQSTVGAGDSMVGAMTLKLAENASLEEMVRFGVAAGVQPHSIREHACAPMTIHKNLRLPFR